MSNSNTNLQTQSSNALYNAIMEAGSKDRPPMLAPANNELSKTNQLMFKDLKKFQAELDKVIKDVNYASKVEIDCAKAKGDLMSYKIDFEKSSNAYTQQINDLNQTISDMKKELCAHQETISIMSQAKEAQIKLYKTCEDKELDKENKVKILPQNRLPIVKNTNVIAPGMYKVHTKTNQTRTPQLHQDIRKPNKRVSFSTGVIPNTSVSRPQLKSNHLRIGHVLNAQTSNVNFVCVTCGKCVLNENHDLCVLHYINGVNSRTKKPMAVPISTRKPKQNVNQSVATSSKKTVATDSTVKKSRNITRKLYEQVSKTCSWWYPKYTPPGYNWKPKSQKGNVKPNISMPLGNASRTANILEHKTPRCSTVPIHPCLRFLCRSSDVLFIDGEVWEMINCSNSWLWRSGSRNDYYQKEDFMLKLQQFELTKARNFLINSSAYFAKRGELDTKTSYCLETPNKTALLNDGTYSVGDRVSSDPVPQCSNQCTSQNELELLYSLMFSELLNGTSPVVSKSFAIPAADNPDKHQQHNTTHNSSITDVADPPPLNIHSTHQTPTQVPTVTAPFDTPVQEQGETSSRHVDTSNMHTFYQHHPSAQRWTKDHPLEQVIGNPSQSVRTRRQLETDGEMCMFALTVSRTKPKNIKEAMADYRSWIDHPEELHQLID
ncbi:hypothetical protein Tco_0059141 [Tanacetum coccineum]